VQCLVERRVVSASADGTVRVWDIDTGVCVHTLRKHKEYVLTLAADKQHIVSESGDHSLKIWDMETGAYLRSLRIPYQGSMVGVAIVGDTVIATPFSLQLYRLF
jgi:WD40 repeat protein